MSLIIISIWMSAAPSSSNSSAFSPARTDSSNSYSSFLRSLLCLKSWLIIKTPLSSLCHPSDVSMPMILPSCRLEKKDEYRLASSMYTSFYTVRKRGKCIGRSKEAFSGRSSCWSSCSAWRISCSLISINFIIFSRRLSCVTLSSSSFFFSSSYDIIHDLSVLIFLFCY